MSCFHKYYKISYNQINWVKRNTINGVHDATELTSARSLDSNGYGRTYAGLVSIIFARIFLFIDSCLCVYITVIANIGFAPQSWPSARDKRTKTPRTRTQIRLLIVYDVCRCRTRPNQTAAFCHERVSTQRYAIVVAIVIVRTLCSDNVHVYQ